MQKKYKLSKKIMIGGNDRTTTINLNDIGYNDTQGLNNDPYIFIDKESQIKMIELQQNSVLWRGFNNMSCINSMSLVLGTYMDINKYDPIWFASPEIALIYACMNSNNILSKTYDNYYIYKHKDYRYINLNTIAKQYKHLLKANIGTIMSYYNEQTCYLIDINDFDTIIKLIKYYDSIDNSIFNNILEKEKEYNGRIYKILMTEIEDYKKKNNISDISDNNIAKIIIKNYFINALTFMKKPDVKEGFKSEIILKKKLFENRNLTRESNDMTSFNSKFERYMKENMTELELIKQKENKITLNKKKYDFLCKSHIQDYLDNENKKYFEIKKQIINTQKNTILYQTINYNESYSIKGKDYTINAEYIGNGDGIPKYKITIKYDINIEKKYKTCNEYADNCKFCRLIETRNWTTEQKDNGALSHIFGDSDQQVYCDLINDNYEKAGFSFQNVRQRSIDNDIEERYLSIPYAHLPTKSDHPRCTVDLSPFKKLPESNNEYTCGALLYENANDAETLFYFMNTYNAGILYAVNKYKIDDYIIAPIDFDRENGKYYKFVDNPLNIPTFYLTFHCRSNSVNHLHLHVYFDKNGQQLINTLESGRNKLSYLNFGNMASGDVFGSNSYSKFKKNNGDKLYYTGEREEIVYEEKDETGITHGCSFQYLFKKIIGIPDDDPRMKHEWIFEKITSDNQLNFKKADDKFLKIFKQEYKDEIKIYKNTKNFTPIFSEIYNPNKHNLNHKNNISDDKYKYIGEISTQYCNFNDTCIIRNSITKYDIIFVLFLKIACYKFPYINGYFAHSNPLLNRFNNITHPEICIFNPSETPLKTLYNTPYTTCRKNKNDLNALIFTLFLLNYHKTSQTTYSIGKLFKQNQVLSGGRYTHDIYTNLYEKNDHHNYSQNKINENKVTNLYEKNDYHNYTQNKINENINIKTNSDINEHEIFFDYILNMYNELSNKNKIINDDEKYIAKKISEILFYNIDVVISNFYNNNDISGRIEYF